MNKPQPYDPNMPAALPVDTPAQTPLYTQNNPIYAQNGNGQIGYPHPPADYAGNSVAGAPPGPPHHQTPQANIPGHAPTYPASRAQRNPGAMPATPTPSIPQPAYPDHNPSSLPAQQSSWDHPQAAPVVQQDGLATGYPADGRIEAKSYVQSFGANAQEFETRNPVSRARHLLTARLIDIVLLPENRITPHERDMAADVLVEMLQAAEFDVRQKAALRLAAMREAPSDILRLLATDDIEVARPILERSNSLDDAELRLIANSTSHAHRLTIAKRENLRSILVEELVRFGDPELTLALARNPRAKFSKSAIENLIALSRDVPSLVPNVLRRRELKPSHALAMFWWAEHAQRIEILKRFSAERRVLQETAGDIFAIAAREGWQDAPSRKALQFIERRQRNRAAIEKSPYQNLEHAIDAALGGFDETIRDEIGYLSGIKPTTAATIFNDHGGEGIAILCKATGLRRDAVVKLWRGLGRPAGRPESPDKGLLRVLEVYDSLSVDRGQTILRYWNFALSSAMPQTSVEQYDSYDSTPSSDLLVAQRTAMLVFGNRGDG